MTASPSEMPLTLAIENRRSLRTYAPTPVTRDQLQNLLWAGQGVTGQDGQRTAPSAHGLHPLQLLVTAGAVEDLAQGIYNVSDGSLHPWVDGDMRDSLKSAAVEDQSWIAEAPLIITVCADFIAPCRAFADQKPYGRRGASYVMIEAGAAAQNIMLMAVSLGLGAVLVAGIDDAKTAELLRLDAPLAPVLHLCIGAPQEA